MPLRRFTLPALAVLALASAPAVASERPDHDFMAANARVEGMNVVPGVQYVMLKSGPAGGAHPSRKDTVKVRYSVGFTDGKLLENSEKLPDGAIEFPLGGLIPAWTTVLPMMRPGDKWRIWSPSEMAYGEKGSPPDIAPNTVLVFEVELVSITPPPAAPKP